LAYQAHKGGLDAGVTAGRPGKGGIYFRGTKVTTQKIAARIPFPEDAARELGFDLAIHAREPQ
jgi:hypothetical protein